MSSVSVRSILSLLYCVHLCMKCSLGILQVMALGSYDLSVVTVSVWTSILNPEPELYYLV